LLGGSGISYKNIRGGVPPYTFPVRSVPYVVGVYYSNPSSSNHKPVNVSFTISGQYCNNGKTGVNCTVSITDMSANPHNVTPASPSYFRTVVSSQPSGEVYKNITFSWVSSSTNITVYGRYAGIPSSSLYDWIGTSTLSSPKLGNYYFQVVTTEAAQINGTTSLNCCLNNTAGSNCDVTITNSSSLADNFDTGTIAQSGQNKIYALYNVAMKSLYVTLYDTSPTNQAIIAASYNRVPNYDTVNNKFDADIVGCNIQYCSKVQAINTNAAISIDEEDLYDSVNGTWYVVIRSNRASSEYNIWFNNICPGNCSGQGTCGTSVNDYGICACNANYDIGLTCKQNNQFIEYIILIIIAALVLVSALLGLIAWAYMRRRAQYVEVR